MTPLDDRIGLPRTAVRALPFLMVPSVLLLVLISLPGTGFGAAMVVLAAVAVSWQILGGVIAFSHLSRRIARYRALRTIRAEVEDAVEPVWACNSVGKVVLQNRQSRDRFGDVLSQNIENVLSRLRTDAEQVFTDLTIRAERQGYAEVELETGQTLTLYRVSDAPLQVWSLYDSRAASGSAPHRKRSYRCADLAGCDTFEAIPVALLILSPEGHIRRANTAARKLLDGRIPDDASTDLYIGNILQRSDRPVNEWLGRFFSGQCQTRTELLRLRSGDGKGTDADERYFQLSLSIDPGQERAMLGVLTDVSEMKTLEAQFVHSQKMQAIGQLAGGVAHDFNNLLTAIGGHCDLLMLRHDKSDPDYADLDQISQNANRAGALVGQLLAFSRKQKLRLEKLDLRDTLSDLSHLLNRLVGERVSLSISHDHDLRPIRVDKRLLEQVIMNLVVNARDAMLEGGEIAIRTEYLQFEEPFKRDRETLPKGEYIRISVRDHGTGIAPEHMEKIFEPFFSTKPIGEGTGLGLSTVYGIVRQTGGYIFVDSKLGDGTTFDIYFPAQGFDAQPEPVQPKKSARSLVAPVSNTATVLLVEDEVSVRSFAARALRMKGHEVFEADSGETALELLKDKNFQVDIFVTDVMMPGMDGPSWVRIALEDRPDAKIVFMSGYSEDVFAEGHSPVPNAVFLAKPFTLADFAETVEGQIAAEGDGAAA